MKWSKALRPPGDGEVKYQPWTRKIQLGGLSIEERDSLDCLKKGHPASAKPQAAVPGRPPDNRTRPLAAQKPPPAPRDDEAADFSGSESELHAVWGVGFAVDNDARALTRGEPGAVGRGMAYDDVAGWVFHADREP